MASLALYVAVYLLVFPLSLYYMGRLVRAGPTAEGEPPEQPIEGLQRPLPARAAAGAQGPERPA